MALANATRKIKIDITSDSICPFCFIGKRKLDKAIEVVKQKGLNIEISRQFHPFLLDPTLVDDVPQDKRARYESKFGKERFVQMEKMMKGRGKEVGIEFSYDGPLSQTTNSHRLISLAYDKGGEALQLSLVENLFSGYFEHGADIGSREFLSEQAVKAGVFSSVEECKEWLATDAKKQASEVARGIRDAQLQGISGVPFFVVDEKYAVSGAQDPEVFVQIFEKLAKDQSPVKKDEDGAQCY
ncbi:hypothetical protein PLICRDRAFT_170182 [Plicaturopsis crispa FD-325 SS-3]|nr:hypothetical protein PLICRDRAFT_170182 [Plicaturopsis crispa FD-325 SS-3]